MHMHSMPFPSSISKISHSFAANGHHWSSRNPATIAFALSCALYVDKSIYVHVVHVHSIKACLCAAIEKDGVSSGSPHNALHSLVLLLMLILIAILLIITMMIYNTIVITTVLNNKMRHKSHKNSQFTLQYYCMYFSPGVLYMPLAGFHISCLRLSGCDRCTSSQACSIEWCASAV